MLTKHISLETSPNEGGVSICCETLQMCVYWLVFEPLSCMQIFVYAERQHFNLQDVVNVESWFSIRLAGCWRFIWLPLMDDCNPWFCELKPAVGGVARAYDDVRWFAMTPSRVFFSGLYSTTYTLGTKRQANCTTPLSNWMGKCVNFDLISIFIRFMRFEWILNLFRVSID